MQSLLEPDPDKRPGVKKVIKEKWILKASPEKKKILSAATYRNK